MLMRVSACQPVSDIFCIELAHRLGHAKAISQTNLMKQSNISETRDARAEAVARHRTFGGMRAVAAFRGVAAVGMESGVAFVLMPRGVAQDGQPRGYLFGFWGFLNGFRVFLCHKDLSSTGTSEQHSVHWCLYKVLRHRFDEG